MTPALCRRAQRGFTLVELMIVIAIVAILAVASSAGYAEFVRRAQRAEARASLVEAAQYLERFQSVHGRYDRTRAGAPIALPAALAASPATRAVHHRVAIQSVDAARWALVATPVAIDARCGVLSLQQDGTRGASGPAGVAACWR